MSNLLHTFTRTLCAAAVLISCSRVAAPADLELREGDLLFRRGRGSKTRAVLAADGAGLYSHVGIVCRSDSGLVVVHAVPGESTGRDTVKADRAEEFLSRRRAVSGAVYRPGCDEAALRRAADYALRALQAGVEFDHDYDLSDSVRLYCTELVWRAFLTSGTDLGGGSRTHVPVPSFEGDYIMPSDILSDPILKQITTYPN